MCYKEGEKENGKQEERDETNTRYLIERVCQFSLCVLQSIKNEKKNSRGAESIFFNTDRNGQSRWAGEGGKKVGRKSGKRKKGEMRVGVEK